MNQEDIDREVEAFRAYLEGKYVEFLTTNGMAWKKVKGDTWSIGLQYRVKSEPRIVYFNITENNEWEGPYKSKEIALTYSGCGKFNQIAVPFREVLEDEESVEKEVRPPEVGDFGWFGANPNAPLQERYCEKPFYNISFAKKIMCYSDPI